MTVSVSQETTPPFLIQIVSVVEQHAERHDGPIILHLYLHANIRKNARVLHFVRAVLVLIPAENFFEFNNSSFATRYSIGP